MRGSDGLLTRAEWRGLARLVETAGGVMEGRALLRLMRYHGVEAHDDAAETSATDHVVPADVETVAGQDIFPTVEDADWWEDAGDGACQDDPAAASGGMELPEEEGTKPSRGSVQWRLVAPLSVTVQTVDAVGIDRNAVQASACEGGEPGDTVDGAAEGTLVHPSEFCPDPVRFLAVLAVLARATPQVRLFQVRSDAEGNPQDIVRVFPDPGEEVLAELDALMPSAAQDIQALNRAVTDALEVLGEPVSDDPPVI